MRGRRAFLGRAAAALATGSLACSIAASPAISRRELAGQIDRGVAPVVLDVRSRSEYDAGHVPGALHVPFQSVASHLDALPADGSQPIVVYCAHGPRAAWAARSLRDAGYTNLRYLEGHMSAWQADGLPLEATPAPETP